MSTVQIRPAERSDLPLVQRLEGEFPSGAGALWTSDEWEFMLDHGYAALKIRSVVAAKEIEPVGFANASARQTSFTGTDSASDSRVLTHVAVRPDARNLGVGRALINGIVDTVSKDGATLLFAHVPDSLRLFYERVGWTVTKPHTGLAWIEQATLRVWDAAKQAGVNPGPRRAASMLRFDTPEADSEYSCIAYRLLDAARMDLLYTFPVPPGGRSTTELAWGYLAFMCLDNPDRFAALPGDVSKLVLDVVRGIQGEPAAQSLARSRR